MSRKAEGSLVIGFTLLAIAGILAAAVSWGPKHDCIAQFPKIIGCALGEYEGLAGGLIAAGGAAFAGWLKRDNSCSAFAKRFLTTEVATSAACLFASRI